MYNVPYTSKRFHLESLNAIGFNAGSLSATQVSALKNIASAPVFPDTKNFVAAGQGKGISDPTVVAGQGKSPSESIGTADIKNAPTGITANLDNKGGSVAEYSVSLGSGISLNKMLLYGGIGVGILVLIYIIKK